MTGATPDLTTTSAPLPADDVVIVFRTDRSRVHGRLVRLGKPLHTIVSRHAMPNFACTALGEALALAALVGSALPADGKLILQTRTDGAVSFLVADYDAAGKLRGYARYDEAQVAVLGETRPDPAFVLGSGHMAMTIDQGGESERYQGIVALEGDTFETAATAYFEQREAVSTFIRLAVAPAYTKANDGGDGEWHWRGGGLMMQSTVAPNSTETDFAADPSDDDDAWPRVKTLAATVEAHELLDPTLSPEQLLLRLFHEEGVRIERVVPLSSYCRCSRQRVLDVLSSFGSKELADMTDEAGRVTATCEFCTARYEFLPSEISEAPL